MADKCRFQNDIISIKDAIKIRDKRNKNQPYPDFCCLKCGKPLQPHAAGGRVKAPDSNTAEDMVDVVPLSRDPGAISLVTL